MSFDVGSLMFSQTRKELVASNKTYGGLPRHGQEMVCRSDESFFSADGERTKQVYLGDELVRCEGMVEGQ